MALQRRWTETITAVIAIIFLLFTLLGVNNTVNQLQVKVAEFEQTAGELDEIRSQIDDLQEQAADLRTFRDDILEAVCVTVADTPRDLRACKRTQRLTTGGG